MRDCTFLALGEQNYRQLWNCELHEPHLALPQVPSVRIPDVGLQRLGIQLVVTTKCDSRSAHRNVVRL